MIIKSINEINVLDLELFDCGNKDLNYFLEKYAKKNDKNGYGKTFLLIDESKIVGYFTLCSASIKFDEFPSYGNDLPKYPIPCVKIARLAVSKEEQNKGYGKELLKQAFIKILYVADNVGIRIILVDAKESSSKFYEKFGFQKLRENSLTYYLMMETLLDAIK